MVNNTKSLVVVSLLIIFAGFSLLWFGLKPFSQPVLTPIIDPSIPGSTSSATAGIEGQRVRVMKVVDGDTIEIEGGLSVRFIGIDTPETVDPRRPVGCFGKEASYEAKRLMEGKQVILQKDVSETDKYKRLLRYVYLPLDPSTHSTNAQGRTELDRSATSSGQVLFVNDYLIREGFAKALTYPPDIKYAEQFLEAEKQARTLQKGLWSRCPI